MENCSVKKISSSSYKIDNCVQQYFRQKEQVVSIEKILSLKCSAYINSGLSNWKPTGFIQPSMG